MTRAYGEFYLSGAQTALGDAFDYAVNVCGIPGPVFADLFCASSACRRIENGEPLMLAGKSGVEIAREVVAETAGRDLDADPPERYDRSPEYWIGWAVAYYQWYSSRRFGEIFNALPFDDLLAMYSTLHEADITKFAGVADERMRDYYRDTNLKRIRVLRGFSQAELAKESGVSLRSVQMYEQRRKDINRAGAGTLFALAKALGCTMEDLIEK